MIKPVKKTFEASDGLKLHGLDWLVPDPKAHIFIIHGLGEHIGRYNHVANYYNGKGMSVSGFDLRGHGLSEGKRGFTPSMEQFIDDITSFGRESASAFVPKILYGHSMGGNLALTYLMDQEQTEKFDLCIVTSPWIKLVKEPLVIVKLVAEFINHFGGFINSNGLDASNISTVKEEVEKYVNDPLVHNKVSSITALNIINAGRALLDSEEKFPIPLFLNHGTSDKITDSQATKRFYDAQENEMIELKLWDGLYHELHNDAKKDELFEQCFNWIKNNL